MKTTLREIKSHHFCVDDWKKICEGLGATDLDIEVTLHQILDINGVKDAYRALSCWDYKDYCLLLADIAESVLYIFEEKYTKDDRPRKAIQAIRDYHVGKISKKELDIASRNSFASVSLADYESSIASDIGVYRGAFRAAYYVACCAMYASRANANTAPYDVGGYACYVAINAADATVYYSEAYARDRQWKKNEELMRKFLEAKDEKDRF